MYYIWYRRLEERCPLQVGQRFLHVQRKQPLDHHGPENARRKRPDGPVLEAICARRMVVASRGKRPGNRAFFPRPKAPERRFAD